MPTKWPTDSIFISTLKLNNATWFNSLVLLFKSHKSLSTVCVCLCISCSALSSRAKETSSCHINYSTQSIHLILYYVNGSLLPSQFPATTCLCVCVCALALENELKTMPINIRIGIDDRSNKFWHLNWTHQKIFYTPPIDYIAIGYQFGLFRSLRLHLFHVFLTAKHHRKIDRDRVWHAMAVGMCFSCFSSFNWWWSLLFLLLLTLCREMCVSISLIWLLFILIWIQMLEFYWVCFLMATKWW